MKRTKTHKSTVHLKATSFSPDVAESSKELEVFPGSMPQERNDAFDPCSPINPSVTEPTYTRIKLLEKEKPSSKSPAKKSTITSTMFNAESNQLSDTVRTLVKETMYYTFEHPYAIVDEQWEVLGVNGDIYPYLHLQPIEKSHILHVAAAGIVRDLKTLLTSAIQKCGPAKGKIRKVRTLDDSHFVRIQVKPLMGQGNLFLVFFEKFGIADLPDIADFQLILNQAASTLPELSKELESTRENIQAFAEDLQNASQQEDHLQLLETALMHTQDGVLIAKFGKLGEEFQFIYANKAFTRMTGYSQEEIQGQSLSILLGPTSNRREISRIRQLIAKRQPIESEIISYTKAGKAYWAQFHILPLTNSAGQVTHWLSFQRDITEQRLTDEKIRQSEQLYRTLARNFPNGTINLVGRDLKIKFIEGSELAELGQTAEMLVGCNIDEIFGPDSSEVIRTNCLQTFEGKSTSFETTFNGRHYNFTTVPLPDTNGEINQFMGVSQNITQQKKVEVFLNDTLAELRKRNYEMDNYVYKVSHDLRAPLCSIMGLVNLIKMEDDPIIIAKYIELIEDRVHKSDYFIQSILHHSKMIQAELQIVKIDFQKIIDTCFDELKYMGNSVKLKIRVGISDSVPFFNDELRITILVRNFISNAIKFLNPNFTTNYLNFTINITGSDAQITIEDNGIGIEREHLSKVFDMFFRGSEKSDGSGLGLYIVKQTIERLGGNIKIQSEAGLGTRFNLTLSNYAEAADLSTNQPLNQALRKPE